MRKQNVQQSEKLHIQIISKIIPNNFKETNLPVESQHNFELFQMQRYITSLMWFCLTINALSIYLYNILKVMQVL